MGMDHDEDNRAAVLACATAALGSATRAARWIVTPCRALHGQRPVDVAQEPGGMRRIEIVLGRLEHGVFS